VPGCDRRTAVRPTEKTMIEFFEGFLFMLVLVLLIIGVIAPSEAISWWKRQGKKDEFELRLEKVELAPLPELHPENDHYLVYLSGIADMDGKTLGQREVNFIEKLRPKIPYTEIVSDIYPYAPDNRTLTGARHLAWLWRKLEQRRKLGKRGFSDSLVRIRNILQVGVSADPRYGAIYNLGTAREMILALYRHGYRVGCGKPITILGSSGGGQIAIGAVTYLSKILNVPIRVISLAGFLSDDPGIKDVEHIYIIYGTRDPVPPLASLLYPGHWAFAFNSDWNNAKADGKVTTYIIGPMKHNGDSSYLDDQKFLRNGQSYLDKTVQVISDVLTADQVTKRIGEKL
jgi:hypothetical protein